MSGAPLVLISQVQRSGGTLLTQLLDGHPQCATYPPELAIGRPRKWDWPDLPASAPVDAWFDLLVDKSLLRWSREGYKKGGSNPHALQHVRPFTLDIRRFHEVFTAACARAAAPAQRDVIAAYFEAFFDNWKDRAATGRERWTVGFTPRVHMFPDSIARFWRDWPDGRLITIVRDPLTWLASAMRHDPFEYPTAERALCAWRASTEATLREQRERPDRVLVLFYADLVLHPRETMARVARFLDIEWTDELLAPTYGGSPMIANSSFAIAQPGVTDEPLRRPIDLPADAHALAMASALPFYQECLAELGA
jgi:hypothetical protein